MKANGNGRDSLEKRVADLESELKVVRAELATLRDRHGWRAFVGTHANSPFYDEMVREMERISDEERAAAQVEKKPKVKARRVAASHG